MANGATPLRTAVVVRKLVLTFVGVFVFAASLTLVFESMRSVMDVGGYCASGGPYEIRQECPDGAWLIVVGIFGGCIGTGLVIAGTFSGGPKLWSLAWPALFLSLGWNFMEYGIDPPPPNEGLVWGWLVCGVLFILMGGLPLLFVLGAAKLTLWGSGAGAVTASASPAPVLPSLASPSRATLRARAPREPDPPDDLTTDLERLSALHADGQLTDDEFTRAKHARLAEEGA